MLRGIGGCQVRLLTARRPGGTTISMPIRLRLPAYTVVPLLPFPHLASHAERHDRHPRRSRRRNRSRGCRTYGAGAGRDRRRALHPTVRPGARTARPEPGRPDTAQDHPELCAPAAVQASSRPGAAAPASPTAHASDRASYEVDLDTSRSTSETHPSGRAATTTRPSPGVVKCTAARASSSSRSSRARRAVAMRSRSRFASSGPCCVGGSSVSMSRASSRK